MRLQIAGVLTLAVAPLFAEALTCDMSSYKLLPGLASLVQSEMLTTTWDGASGQEVQLQFALHAGVPVIRQLSLRPKGGRWVTLVRDAPPPLPSPPASVA